MNMVRTIAIIVVLLLSYFLFNLVETALLFFSVYPDTQLSIQPQSSQSSYYTLTLPLLPYPKSVQKNSKSTAPPVQSRSSSPSVFKIQLTSYSKSPVLLYITVKNPNNFFISLKPQLSSSSCTTPLYSSPWFFSGLFPTSSYNSCEDLFTNPSTNLQDFSTNPLSGIIEGQKEAVLGPIFFSPKYFGDFFAEFFLNANGEAIGKIEVNGKVEGAQFEVSKKALLYQKDKEKSYYEILVKNIGGLPGETKGLHFEGYRCEFRGFKILDCGMRLKLQPGESYSARFVVDHDFSAFAYNLPLWLDTIDEAIELYIEFEVECLEEEEVKILIGYVIIVIAAFCRFSHRRFKVTVKEGQGVSWIEGWKKKTYREPVFLCERAKLSKNAEKMLKIRLSHTLVIDSYKPKSLDEFTVASVTTDTRLNSPANSFHTEEEDSNVPDDELYLDMYKLSGIFAQNQTELESLQYIR